MVGDAGSLKDGRFATQLSQMPKGKAGEQMINSTRITEILKSIWVFIEYCSELTNLCDIFLAQCTSLDCCSLASQSSAFIVQQKNPRLENGQTILNEWSQPLNMRRAWALTQTLCLPNPPEILIAHNRSVHWGTGGRMWHIYCGRGPVSVLTLLISCRTDNAQESQPDK